ncbi:hypothetical protein ACE38W_06875 [Chitinophaga sp. Hz27]|uniref:hypothetical protein n=1 Tax=Chitinophaga sp. Hz27 TaxID=3347169 RepID=UPI0035DEE20E
MGREVTPEMVKRVENRIKSYMEHLKNVIVDEPYNDTVVLSEDLLELRKYLSNEKNADDSAFSGWCAEQRGEWQKQQDNERAAYKEKLAMENKDSQAAPCTLNETYTN